MLCQNWHNISPLSDEGIGPRGGALLVQVEVVAGQLGDGARGERAELLDDGAVH